MESSQISLKVAEIYQYSIVAGSSEWSLAFEAKLTPISNCPTSLKGIEVNVDGKNQVD